MSTKENNIHVKVEDGVKTLEIRTGDALRLPSKNGVFIISTIRGASHVFKERKPKDESTHVLFDYKSGKIQLVMNEGMSDGMIIESKLVEHSQLKELNLNSDHSWTFDALHQHLKMNMDLFPSAQDGKKFLMAFSETKISVNRTFEDKKDLHQKNVQKSISQKIGGDMPELVFDIAVPLFEGEEKVKIKCVIVFDISHSISFRLEAPALEAMKREHIKQVLDEEKKKFSCIALDIITSTSCKKSDF